MTKEIVRLSSIEDIEKYFEMKHNAERLQNQVIQLEYQRDALTKENERIKKEGLNDLNKQKQEFERQMRSQREDLDRRNQLTVQEEASINARKAHLDSLEQKKKDLINKENELNEKFIFVQNKITEANNLKSEADGKLQQIGVENGKRATELAEIEQEKRELEAVKSSNQNNINQIKEEQKKLTELKTECEKASQYLSNKDDELKKEEGSLKEKKNELDKKEVEITKKEADLNLLEKNLLKKEEKLTALAQELAIFEQNLKSKEVIAKAKEK